MGGKKKDPIVSSYQRLRSAMQAYLRPPSLGERESEGEGGGGLQPEPEYK